VLTAVVSASTAALALPPSPDAAAFLTAFARYQAAWAAITRAEAVLLLGRWTGPDDLATARTVCTVWREALFRGWTAWERST
jgi:hypothetical protein